MFHKACFRRLGVLIFCEIDCCRRFVMLHSWFFPPLCRAGWNRLTANVGLQGCGPWHRMC